MSFRLAALTLLLPACVGEPAARTAPTATVEVQLPKSKSLNREGIE